MTKARYTYIFSLSGQDHIDFETARAKFKVIDIVKLGIKEALNQCPSPSRKLMKDTMDKVEKEFEK